MCSETRAAHKLSAKLNRDIIIGGTTLDTPSEFLDHLKVIHNAFLQPWHVMDCMLSTPCIFPRKSHDCIVRDVYKVCPSSCRNSEMRQNPLA